MSEPSILSRHTGYLVTGYNFFEYEACRPGRRRHVVSRHVVSHDVSRAPPGTRRIPRRRARRFRARTLEPRPRNERIYNLSSWVRARCAIATSSVPRTRRRIRSVADSTTHSNARGVGRRREATRRAVARDDRRRRVMVGKVLHRLWRARGASRRRGRGEDGRGRGGRRDPQFDELGRGIG